MKRIELLKRLNEALTYDKVSEKLYGVADPSDPLDLGVVIHCVRKLMRQAVKMTDKEFEELITLHKDDEEFDD